MQFLLTTLAGLEDVVAAEARDLGAAPREELRGKVLVEGSPRHVVLLPLAAKTAERAYVLLTRDRASTLEEVYRAARRAPCAFLGRNQSFAVRATRVGDHPFHSPDVAGHVGQAIIDAHRAAGEPRPPVSLNYPRVEFKAWLLRDDFLLGVNATGEGLHKRRYRIYQHPAPLNACLAAALLRLAGYDGGALMDPFCGSATVLVEAIHRARGVHTGCFRTDFPFRELPWFDREVHRTVLTELTEGMDRVPLRLRGTDVSPKHVAGARLNAKAAFADDALDLTVGDARDLPADLPELVVTNPPYGLRVGSVKRLEATYRGFAAALGEHPGTRLALVSAYPHLDAVLPDWKLLEARTVRYGNLDAQVRHYRVE